MNAPAPLRARRWVSEENVLAEMERLSDLSMATVAEYAVQAKDAAQAEAEYKRLAAVTKLRAQARTRGEGGRVSAAQAEIEADADPVVAGAYMDRLCTAAAADAAKEALRSIRANQEALRTAAASARDGVNGPGWKGTR